jgi:ABC-2 type transport system permease protein
MSAEASNLTAGRRTVFNRRVKVIMENEWWQLLGNRVVVFTTFGPPLVLVALALVALYSSRWLDNDLTALNLSKLSTAGEEYKGIIGALKETQALQRDLRFTLLTSFLILFQIIPMVVPLAIASHSIVGEKQNRSLEPLLAAPISTGELLFAKAMSAMIPGLLVTWYGFALFAFGARYAVSDAVYQKLIIGPTWLLSIVLMTPLFTLLTVGLCIIISSKVKDANTAQQLGTVVILPLLGVMIVQMFGVTNSRPILVLFTAAFVGFLDVVVLRMAVRLFRREEILTSWR